MTAHPIPLDAGVARIVGWLDAGRREAFEERAAIFEYDAKMRRLEAERLALIHILAREGFPSGPRCRVLEVAFGAKRLWIVSTAPGLAEQRFIGDGATEVRPADLDVVVRERFGDQAVLAALPTAAMPAKPR